MTRRKEKCRRSRTKRQSEEITKRVQAGDEVPIEKRKKDNYIWVVEEKSTFKGKDDMPSYTYKPDPTSGKWNKVNFTDSSHKAIALCGGCKQPKPPIVVRHSTTGKGRCATISNPTLDRLKLRSIVRYSSVVDAGSSRLLQW